MNIVVVGCGRVGAAIAADLDTRGHRVTIIDVSTDAFDRLPSTFNGNAVVAKINDPVRAEAYADLGIATICRTDLMTHALLTHLQLPVGPAPRVREAAPHPHLDDPVRPAVAGADVARAGAMPAREA